MRISPHSSRFSALAAVLPVLLVLGLLSAGCDSSEPPPPTPSATFSASVSGDTTASMEGGASLVDAGAAGSFAGALIPISFRDTLDLPDAGAPPEGTIITLQQNLDSDGFTRNDAFSPAIILFLPGEDGPNAQSYQVQNPLFSAISGGFGSPIEFDPSALPVSATYIEPSPSSVRTALGSRGTITITRVTEEGVFGEFSFETDQALTISGLRPMMPGVPTDSTFGTPDIGLERFSLTVDGTFEAQRVDPSEFDDDFFAPESFNP
jgi:hypothetical protein